MQVDKLKKNILGGTVDWFSTFLKEASSRPIIPVIKRRVNNTFNE